MKLEISQQESDPRRLPEPGQEGYETMQGMLEFFGDCMDLVVGKERHYGGAWKKQGWMGNLGRIMSKTARLRNMLWQDVNMESSQETVEDTIMDLANLCGFFHRNYVRKNRWGN